jgi:hypothetical protein
MGKRKAVGTRIADALLTLLQNGSAPYWSQSGETSWVLPVTFTRTCVPEMQKEKIQTPKGFVVVGSVEGTEYDRAFEYFDFTIGVGIAKSIGVNSSGRESDVDDCVSLMEQIQDFVCWENQQTLTLPAVLDDNSVEISPSHTARLILPFENNPMYDPQLLRTDGVFLSVTNFVYHFEKQRVS